MTKRKPGVLGIMPRFLAEHYGNMFRPRTRLILTGKMALFARPDLSNGQKRLRRSHRNGSFSLQI